MGNFSSLISRLNLVKQIPIFSGLNWFELQKIARKAIITEHKKGDLISKEGTPPDYFYCLISGRVQAYTTGPDGKKENVDFIHRGMYFGVISVLTGENHSMSFEAINDSVVLKIPVEDFKGILKSIPSLGVELSQHLSRRIRRNVKGGGAIFESTVISVYSPVKGLGSSTYAVNLAVSLQRETRKKVIHVSIYSSASSDGANPAGAFDETPGPCWKNPAVELDEIAGDHEKIMRHVISGDLKIDLLNVMFDPLDATLKDEIGAFVGALVGDYHYVVVDLPNEMDDVVLEALTQSDLVHLVAAGRGKDLELVRGVLDNLERRLKDRFKEDKIRILLRERMTDHRVVLEQVNQYIDYHIYGVLPDISGQDQIQKVDTPSLKFIRADHRAPYARAVTRIARQIGGVSIGLALGGGAALGLAHIGALKVLEQEDIPIDMITGSSMGALVGGLWAVGHDAGKIKEVAKEFESFIKRWGLIDPPIFPVSGLVRGQAIRRWLVKHFGSLTFNDVRVPLKVVAYDLVSREDVVIGHGSIAEAVRRSIAIPGVIRPVKDKDKLIIDGGVLNPLPTNVLAGHGIKKIIAVNVLQSPRDVSEGFEMTKKQRAAQVAVALREHPLMFLKFRIFNILFRIFNPNISDIIIRTLQASEYVISEQSAHQADVVIHPNLIGFKWYQIERVDDLVQQGEEAARGCLPEIKKLIEQEREIRPAP